MTWLFAGEDLDAWLRGREQSALAEVENATEQDVIGADAQRWAEALAEKHRVDHPELKLDDQHFADQGEYSGDFRPARELRLVVPFDGDAEVFRYRPLQIFVNGFPEADIAGNTLQWTMAVDSGKAEEAGLDRLAAERIGRITTWLGFGRDQTRDFNTRLGGSLRAAIVARQDRLRRDHDFFARSSIPVRRRDDAPTTYATPVVRRARSHSAAAAVPQGSLEPVLETEAFEHALEVIRRFGRTMERTPATYVAIDEEARRDIILAALNTHFEGRATGETFNASGKTDILIRVDDRNVLVGECKRWSGASAFSASLDQLLRYATWRDTKLCLVVFIETRGFAEQVEKARSALENHSRFGGWRDAPPGELRAAIAWPAGDQGVGDLRVLFYHLPTT